MVVVLNYKSKKSFAYSLCQNLLVMGIVFLLLLGILGPTIYDVYMKRRVISQLQIVYSKLLQANQFYALSTSSDTNNYDVTLPVNKFAETYFVPYLPVKTYCKTSQDACWNSIQFKDLAGNDVENYVKYSIELDNKAVLGFSKNKDNQITIVVDIDGKTGANRLGRDVFVFYIYNSDVISKLCPNRTKYVAISNGIHKGGYDECGIPHDAKPYMILKNENLADSCSESAMQNPSGIGAGAACLALIFASHWSIDKFYPW